MQRSCLEAFSLSAPAWPFALAPPQTDRDSRRRPDLHPIEARVVERTNSQRAQHGLPPLAVDPRLLSSARNHAAWMTNSRSMAHTTQPVGENIAMGQHSSAEVINCLDEFVGTSGQHSQSRLHARIGVAAFTTPDGTIYWCQQFLR